MKRVDRSLKLLRRAPKVCAALVVLLALAALTGWFTGSRILSGIRAHYIPMAPNTALCFILLSTALALWRVRGGWRHKAAPAGAWIVLAISAIRFVEYLTDYDLSVDRWLFRFPAEKLGLAPLGRMSLPTTVSFLFLSSALLLSVSAERTRVHLAQALAAIVTFVGLAFCLGYAYGKPLLYGGQGIPMALNTSASFLLIGAGCVSAIAARDLSYYRAARARTAAQHAVTRVLSEAETLREAAPHILQAAARPIGWNIATLWRADPLSDKLYCAETWRADEATDLHPATSDDPQKLAPGEDIPGIVWSERRPIWRTRATLLAGEKWPDSPAASLMQTQFAVPVAIEQKCFGVLEFFHHEPVERDKELLQEMTAIGSQIAQFAKRRQVEEEIARRNAEIGRDLEFAREFQEALMPRRYPHIPTNGEAAPLVLNFHHYYRPTLSVGGDFFDVVKLSDNHVGIFIADVMGHGTRSALITAILRTLLEGAAHHISDPGQFLQVINNQYLDIVERSEQFVFVSAFYLIVDAENAQAMFASAGHPTPLCAVRATGTVGPLMDIEYNGLALGVSRDTTYPTCTRSVAPGDVFLLMTDGILEAPNAAMEEFGYDRLTEAVRENLDLPLLEMTQSVIGRMTWFIGAATPPDDICLVGVEALRAQALSNDSVDEEDEELPTAETAPA